MKEAHKTGKVRGSGFSAKYFGGRVLDIGPGRDLVTPHAEPFDIEHGDANHILQYLKPQSYDCVHSSHCLEHMYKPEQALHEWWELVAPGGYLIIVVPHEDLYEQGIWPSIFNLDHKATFRLKKDETWSSVSYDLYVLCQALAGSEVVDAEIQDARYDHKLITHGFSGDRLPEYYQSQEVFHSLRRIGALRFPVWRVYQRFVFKRGVPVDQTLAGALAQIQVIVQKKHMSDGAT